MARQVLNVQKYPDLRQYPGGPPERPYDAAGWTLPLQMGVRVVAAAAPLTDEVRANLKLLGPAPDPKREADAVQLRRVAGCRAVRQRARHRLRHESQRCGDRAAARTDDRAPVRRWPWIPRRTTRFARSTARGRSDWRERAAVAAGTTRRALHHQRPVGGGAGRARARRSRSSPSAPTADRQRRCRARASGSSAVGRQHGRGLDALGARTVPASRSSTLRPADFRSPLAAESGRRDPGRGRDGFPSRPAAPAVAVEARALAAADARVRPEYADLVSAEDLARFEQFVRERRDASCASAAPARSRSRSSSCR